MTDRARLVSYGLGSGDSHCHTVNPPRDFAGNGAPGVFHIRVHVENTLAVPRCTVFIDGSNFYHGLRRLGVDSQDIDYPRLAKKLLVDRELQGIRYYVGRLSGDLRRVRRQNRVLSALRRQGVHVALGRVEQNAMRPDANPLVGQLRELIAMRRAELPQACVADLESLCDRDVTYYVEKQVDVLIAVDMLGMAQRDEYDLAYLLSADGDFVPVVREIQRQGKRVFMASPWRGHQLAHAADAFIHLTNDWLDGLASR